MGTFTMNAWEAQWFREAVMAKRFDRVLTHRKKWIAMGATWLRDVKSYRDGVIRFKRDPRYWHVRFQYDI